ncbi:MAG: Nif3-like dinuclear metal center hexameric protein [Propionibacteriales bacterium]|nr:Nif3-like dinuclear metal center hexameric protein [Propionibacteriales bacterium]
MTGGNTLGDVVAAIEVLYPKRWAVDGDAIGLIVGDPADTVRTIGFAVDPVQAVLDEAVERDADLLVVHHPLLYRAVQSVAADSPKGRVVHGLIRRGIGLYVAHTNADVAGSGVSEAIADALGLNDVRPLAPDPVDPLDKVVTFVPRGDVERMVDALSDAGAGAIGDYDRCAFVSMGEGTFRPGAQANPAIGTRGEIELVGEARVEMVLPRASRMAVLAALRAAHPYEEPAFDVLELATWDDNRGHGRVGELAEPLRLGEFVDRVIAALPSTAVGARVAGDLDQEVSRVALAGGAGDFLLDEARATGADVYLTSDLRHHPASELREHPDAPALVDVPHWAAEWMWLPVAERALTSRLPGGAGITTYVSRLCTDPWTHRVGDTGPA